MKQVARELLSVARELTAGRARVKLKRVRQEDGSNSFTNTADFTYDTDADYEDIVGEALEQKALSKKGDSYYSKLPYWSVTLYYKGGELEARFGHRWMALEDEFKELQAAGVLTGKGSVSVTWVEESRSI